MPTYADLPTTPPLPGLAGVGDMNNNFNALIAALYPSSLTINDDFSVWQNSQALGSTAVADDIYTSCDGFYVLTQTASVNVSQLTFPENGYPFALRVTQNQASAQRFGLAQIIEAADSQRYRGGNIAGQARIRCSSSQAIRYALCEWVGTADAVTSDIVASWTSGTYTPGNFFLASNLNVLVVGAVTPTANVWTDLAAVTAACGNSANNLILFVWTEGTAAQNVTLDFNRFLIQPGASIFKPARLPYAVNLERCQRFLPVFDAALGASSPVGAGFLVSGTTARITYRYPKRTLKAPTGVTVLNAANFVVENLAASTAASGVGLVSAGTDACEFNFTVTGLTAGQGVVGRAGNVNCLFLLTGSQL